MPQSPATGVPPTGRAARKPLQRVRVAGAILALGLVWLSPAGQAQQISTAPAFIDLEEAQLQTPAGARLAETQDRFRNALDDDPGRAIALAKDIVRQTAGLYGGDHANVSVALTNLAILQAEDGAFEEAIENYSAAIAMTERATGSMTSDALINPLHGMAATHMALDEAELAIPLYERAIQISHVNEGPNNLEQVPSAEALSRAWLSMGQRRRATEIQEQIYRLQQRSLDPRSDAYADALMRRARWYDGLGDYDKSAKSYQRAVASIRGLYGDTDRRLIEPLLAYATAAPRNTRLYIEDELAAAAISRGNSYAMKRSSWVIAAARRAANEAVVVARANAEEDPRLLPLTLVAQGDWMMRRRERNAAWRAYREAWALLDADPGLHALRDEVFAEPALLAGGGFDRIYSSGLFPPSASDTFPERGHVELRYNVNAAGRPVNVQILGSKPAGLLDGQVYMGLPNFIYRPAYRDGRPVMTTDLEYRHQFRYNGERFTERERAFIERIETERAMADAKRKDRGAG